MLVPLLFTFFFKNYGMETKFTKGEWTSRLSFSKEYFLISPINTNVYPIGGMSIEEAEANAKLMAAAPDLLKRLLHSNVLIKALLSGNISGYRDSANETIELNNDTIKKATE